MRCGCDTNVTDRAFYTAIHHAAHAGHADLISAIATAATPHVDGQQPSSSAASTSGSSSSSSSSISVDVNVKARHGVTPLMLAAHGGHWRTVDELLRLGARPDMVDRHRATALVYALTSTTTETHELCMQAIVKALIRHNANVDEQCNLKALSNAMQLPNTVIRCTILFCITPKFI